MQKTIDRFMNFVSMEPMSGCWLWSGATVPSGRRQQSRYPMFKFNKKNYRGNRMSWMLFRGNVSGGLHVLHKCDVPLCVNPDHLFLGTHDENMKDKLRKNRDHNQRKGSCPKGHAYELDNLYSHPDGSRKCRTCMAKSIAAWDSSHRKERQLAALSRFYKKTNRMEQAEKLRLELVVIRNARKGVVDAKNN